MMVEGRCAHLHPRRQLVDAQRSRVVDLEPVDGFRDAITLAIDSSDLPQPCPLICIEQPIVNFPQNQRRQHRDSLGFIE
ncbi:hypothetical protein D3C84_1002680 [compost metagenome]